MRIFKTIDKKLSDIGFVKIEENEYGAVYDRYNDKFKYTQRVNLVRKTSGKHIMQSYDPDLFDSEKIGNTCVGLTSYEMKLFCKKMKQLRLTYKEDLI